MSVPLAEPFVARRIFLKPGVGRGNDEPAAGVDELRQAREAFRGVGQPVDEIGHENEVETADVGREIAGVTAGEGDVFATKLVR